MSMIRITSIPITETVVESLELNIAVTQLTRLTEHDREKKQSLTERMDYLEKLLHDFKHALKEMKDEKG